MEILLDLLVKDYFVLFLVIGLGIAIGKIQVKGICFDLSAVIFVAIFFGYLYNLYGVKFNLPPIIQSVGLVLFIYTIGMQAGPSFFNAFKEQGVKLIVLAGITVVSGGLTAVAISYMYGVDMSMMSGLLTGALTSTPGLAAAIEASKSPLASIGYGIAYPFGVLGVILFVKLSPTIFKVDIKKEEDDFKIKSTSSTPKVIHRNLVISNENVQGKSIKDLNIRFMTKANISRIMKPNQESISPTPNTVLELGDVVKAVGTENAIKRIQLLLGNFTDQQIPRSDSYEVKWYIVSDKHLVNKTLDEIDLFGNYTATITRIRRSSIDLAPHPTTRLRYGDKVLISCRKGNIVVLEDLFGNSIKQVNDTSFLPVAFGIAIGILIGFISIPFGSFNFKLGLTGGVLLASLFLSWKGKLAGIIWNFSGPANQVLRQFGLLLFLTPVGINAGQSLVSAINTHGPILFLYGAIITLVPMIATVVVGRFVLKLNFLSILGALTGGMTSTPGLSASDSMTECDAPQIAYAAVYPFALVLIIVVAEIMGML
ncbi:aspartate:alanine exchanger family transporter [Wenyingzhuangia sp. 2_MG-2023]|uniref:aspartate:alanine exchanger family transporter n=1 Tax=Wenyingzhuangia sp. 2_MG-2023 TaxID=3062639 RepID=UPI0026E1A3B7|nr:TrkA C-terminal domain-containing protein [Wenyingzhuangia sp. 2_MG-2023]MDO6737918.1 TrkA C-terminal domain-containing protein [Wenyingzhuangia sp. 2_MG-2023]